MSDIPAGTIVVVTHKRGEALAITETPCYGLGRWPFVRRWLGDRWSKRAAKGRVVRVANADDRRRLGPP